MAQRSPLALLFLVSGASAVIVAVVNVCVLAASSEVALLRDLALLVAVLGRPGVPRLFGDVPFSAPILAALLNHPFALHDPLPLLEFLGLATLATLLVGWMAAALAAPLVVLVARLLRQRADHRAACWWWRRAYPLGVLAAFTAPAALPAAHAALRGSGPGAIAAATLAVALAAWVVLLLWLRRPGPVRRLLRRVVVASAGIAVVIASGAAVAAALWGGLRAPRESAGGRPNVLLVSIDSLRPDHLHCYGAEHDTSPVIDALARDGTRFQTVVSPSSWTLPAHLTLLTGLPPERHGVVDDATRLRGDALFLTEVLWQAGYTTAGFVSAPYLDAMYGFSQGFDLYDDYSIAKRSFEASQHGSTSPLLLGIFDAWLERWNADGRERPFFAFLHMWDVHYDYTPPPPYDTMFDPDYRGSVTGEDFELGTQVHVGMDPRDLAHVVALYDGEIRYTDHYLGLVLERLRALGILDQTIVVVTADHGDEFLEHGRKGHKQALYDESILVPLIIRYPGTVPAGRVVNEQVRLMDVGPTILTLAGLPRPADFGAAGTGPYAARDLGPWVTAPPDRRPPPLPAFSDLVGDAPVPLASIRTPDLKLIQEQGAGGREELYALASDPGERTNLLPGAAPAVVPLQQELSDWRTTWSDRHLAAAATLDEEHRERLRALGYLK